MGLLGVLLCSSMFTSCNSAFPGSNMSFRVQLAGKKEIAVYVICAHLYNSVRLNVFSDCKRGENYVYCIYSKYVE